MNNSLAQEKTTYSLTGSKTAFLIIEDQKGQYRHLYVNNAIKILWKRSNFAEKSYIVYPEPKRSISKVVYLPITAVSFQNSYGTVINIVASLFASHNGSGLNYEDNK